MGLTIGHVKSLTMGDTSDTNLLRPSDWNSNHAVTFNPESSEIIKYVSAGSNSVSSGTVSFDNGGGVSFGMATNGVITAAAPAGAAPERRYKELIQGERLTTCAALSATQFTNRPIISPFWMDGTGMQPNTVRFLVSLAGSSNRSFGGTFQAGLYQQVNSTQMSRVASDSMSFSNTNTALSATYNGAMLMDFTGMSNYTVTAEGRYALAFQCNPVSANATWMAASMLGADNMPPISRILRGNTTAATGEQILPWWGVYSATTAALPATIGLTQVKGGNSASLVDYYAILKEL